jgi:hypothetical protein
MNIKGIRSRSAIPNKKEEIYNVGNWGDFDKYEDVLYDDNNINKNGKIWHIFYFSYA